MRVGLVVVVCGLLGLAGCSSGVVGGANEAEGSQTPAAGAKLTGVVHGGQNPISGAHVYLFAAASGAGGAGAAAYGGSGIAASASNASQSLLNATSTGHSDSVGAYVLSGSDGSFSISGDYTCTPGQQVYLYALGGDPGLGTGANAAAGLMAALGSCPTGGNFLSGTSPITYMVVNEVSTVAAAYAMAGFATDATHVGSSGTALALTGIGNAFANAANLETIGTGVALATIAAGTGTVPQAEINTLANILAACANSNGTGSACTTLFANAESGGTTGTVAADTATAAINIAHNPGAGLAALYGLASGTPPFGGGLSSAPNDFTIALSFAGDGIYRPGAIAIDNFGDVFVANNYIYTGVTELFSVGLPFPLAEPNGCQNAQPQGIAIAGSGWVWTTNPYGNCLAELNNYGYVNGGSSGFTGGGISLPEFIAIDSSGNAWATNLGNSISKFGPTGPAISGSGGYTGGGLNHPWGIAIDGAGNVWVTAYNRSSISEFDSSGSPVSGSSGYTGGGLNGAWGIAIDRFGNAWITNDAGNSISEFNSSGAPISGSGYTGGGLNGPLAIAIDGAGNVWAANPAGKCVSEFNSSGTAISGSSGYVVGTANPGAGVAGLAVDGSGNIWVSATGSLGVAELVGAGTPVITPIAAGLPATPSADGSSNLGTRP